MASQSGILIDCFSPLVDRSVPEVEKFLSSTAFLDASSETKCSKSKPVSVEVLPKLVLNKDKLKAHCRSGVQPSIRSKLWLEVVCVQDHDSVLMAKTLGEPQEGTVERERGWGRGVWLEDNSTKRWLISCYSGSAVCLL